MNESIKKTLCTYFLVGNCTAGGSCNFLHEKADSKSVLCRFVNTEEGCKYGESCIFSHGLV